MEAGGSVEGRNLRHGEHKITGGLAFSEVHVGMAGNQALELGKRGASVADLTFASDTNARTGTLDIETINPTCIE
jgi:hypothetical protein